MKSIDKNDNENQKPIIYNESEMFQGGERFDEVDTSRKGARQI